MAGTAYGCVSALAEVVKSQMLQMISSAPWQCCWRGLVAAESAQGERNDG